MTILAALAAAFCNALNLVTQHIASTSDPEHSKGWRFVRYLLSNPLWLFGWVALAGAFVFQALALHLGQMSVVQPLLVTELVFALVMRRVWIHQQIRAVTWTAAALTCGALALFVAVSEPTGGTTVASSSAWAGAIAATAGGADLPRARCHCGARPCGGRPSSAPPPRSCGRWWRRSSRRRPTR